MVKVAGRQITGSKPHGADTEREVPFGKSWNVDIGSRFANNTVTTSKYTVFNFVPKNLYEQFQKAANAYFMFISILLFIGETTLLYEQSIKAYSTFLTLAFMMACSAALFAYDDYWRHVADNHTNKQPADVIRGGDRKKLVWSSVQVGDMLIVRAGEELPADIVPFVCSGEEGSCYVSTANLDGETNLKLKGAIPLTQAELLREGEKGASDEEGLLKTIVERLSSIEGTVKAEAPTRSIHSFNGSVCLNGNAEKTLDAKQLLLRGTTLRNTSWCVGLVVYTGWNTRVVMNSRKAPMKLSNLERVINVSMLVILAAQALMAIVSAICYTANADNGVYRGYWYLSGGDELILPNIIAFTISMFGLYSNLMPISLYATVEVCNATQALFIKCDRAMYDEVFDTPAMVRSTNLCQEIGQLEYIFSDKTGTLTQNVMELKQVSINGEVYGEINDAPGFQDDGKMKKAQEENGGQRKAIDDFLEVLAVGHTVMATRDGSGEVKYEAESPDEDALVSATARLGWKFNGRTGQSLDVNVGENMERRTYTVLALNAFTSSRKRMSVIVKREKEGDYFIFVKGADNVMLERERSAKVPEKIQDQLSGFASKGLRTLVIGRRLLKEAEFKDWQEQYDKAQVQLQGREEALADVAAKIEKELEVLGVTAIEDKLQVGVAETIVSLRRAGIKLWVLTGDKLETARNIGFSTNVLSNEMKIMILDVEDVGTAEVERKLGESLEEKEAVAKSAANGECVAGLMVTGQALEVLKGSPFEAQFLKIAQCCSVVIACRVSPLQKAEMVQLVRNNVTPRPVTLAVGDGANDVPMIQQAQVGVGICGREGRQAVNAADFAIGQFRFLQRLLLVHGRLNYRRTCKFTLYTFWRNAVQVLLMFFYSFVSGYSGISIFETKVRMTFNVILSIPIIATGIFDRDVDDATVIGNPGLYETGRLGLDLNPVRMAETLLSALIHALSIWCIATLAYPGMALHMAGDYYSFGTAVYTFLILVCNYRVCFLTLTWNWISVAALAVSTLMYVVFLMVYGVWESLGPGMYSVPYHMVSNGPFWVSAAAILTVAVSVDMVVSYVLWEFFPGSVDLVLEKLRRGLSFLDLGASHAAQNGGRTHPA